MKNTQWRLHDLLTGRMDWEWNGVKYYWHSVSQQKHWKCHLTWTNKKNYSRALCTMGTAEGTMVWTWGHPPTGPSSTWSRHWKHLVSVHGPSLQQSSNTKWYGAE